MSLEKKEIDNEIKKEKVRFLEVNWRDYKIGYLMKEYNVGYMFRYDSNGLKEARANGYRNIPCFGKANQSYTSPNLWEIFRCRIPKGSRRNLEQMLKGLNVSYTKGKDGQIKFDDFDYLAQSHGILMTDFYSLNEVDFVRTRNYRKKLNPNYSSQVSREIEM